MFGRNLSMRRILLVFFEILCIVIVFTGCSSAGAKDLSMPVSTGVSSGIANLSVSGDGISLLKSSTDNMFSVKGANFLVEGCFISIDDLDSLQGSYYTSEDYTMFDVGSNSAFSYRVENGDYLHGIFVGNTPFGLLLKSSNVDDIYVVEQNLSFSVVDVTDVSSVTE